MLNFKKPSRLIIVAAVMSAVVSVAGCALNRSKNITADSDSDYTFI